MAKEVVEVKTNKVKIDGSPAETAFGYDFGDNLEQAVGMFGEKVVFSLYKAKAVVQVQDVARNAMIAGKSPAEASSLAERHKLGESTTVTKDPLTLGKEALAKMSPEERRAYLRELMARAEELGE